MVQWLQIHLSMQGTWVQSLVREQATGQRSLCATATEPVCSGAHTTTGEKLLGRLEKEQISQDGGGQALSPPHCVNIWLCNI